MTNGPVTFSSRGVPAGWAAHRHCVVRLIVAIGVGAADSCATARHRAEAWSPCPASWIFTHLRQPGGGMRAKSSLARAAAVGRITAVHAMANTTPLRTWPPSSIKVDLGEAADWVEVRVPSQRDWK